MYNYIFKLIYLFDILFLNMKTYTQIHIYYLYTCKFILTHVNIRTHV